MTLADFYNETTWHIQYFLFNFGITVLATLVFWQLGMRIFHTYMKRTQTIFGKEIFFALYSLIRDILLVLAAALITGGITLRLSDPDSLIICIPGFAGFFILITVLLIRLVSNIDKSRFSLLIFNCLLIISFCGFILDRFLKLQI